MQYWGMILSKYKKNRPENAFREIVSTREVYRENDFFFSGALRNTRKSFWELCGTVSGREKFSDLLRQARQGAAADKYENSTGFRVALDKCFEICLFNNCY